MMFIKRGDCEKILKVLKPEEEGEAIPDNQKTAEQLNELKEKIAKEEKVNAN